MKVEILTIKSYINSRGVGFGTPRDCALSEIEEVLKTTADVCDLALETRHFANVAELVLRSFGPLRDIVDEYNTMLYNETMGEPK